MSFEMIAFVLPIGLDTQARAMALALRGLHPFEGLRTLFGTMVARLPACVFGTGIGGRYSSSSGSTVLAKRCTAKKAAEQISFGSFPSLFPAGLEISDRASTAVFATLGVIVGKRVGFNFGVKSRPQFAVLPTNSLSSREAKRLEL